MSSMASRNVGLLTLIPREKRTKLKDACGKITTSPADANHSALGAVLRKGTKRVFEVIFLIFRNLAKGKVMRGI